MVLKMGCSIFNTQPCAPCNSDSFQFLCILEYRIHGGYILANPWMENLWVKWHLRKATAGLNIRGPSVPCLPLLTCAILLLTHPVAFMLRLTPNMLKSIALATLLLPLIDVIVSSGCSAHWVEKLRLHCTHIWLSRINFTFQDGQLSTR